MRTKVVFAILILAVFAAFGISLYFAPFIEKHNASISYRVYTVEGAMYELNTESKFEITTDWVRFTFEDVYVRIPKERIEKIEQRWKQ